jgi:hypothetical protein
MDGERERERRERYTRARQRGAFRINFERPKLQVK